MGFSIRPFEKQDSAAVLEIFNHYAANSMAAFYEGGLSPQFVDGLSQAVGDYPFVVAETGGQVVGFGLLRPYHPSPVFRRTAELTYFIAPDYTRQGLGSLFFDFLEQAARVRGVACLLASIARDNQASRAFHQAKGFAQCGLLQKVGAKFGQDLDVVLMQKHL